MKKLAPCGTDAAYHRHRKRGEATCDACRRAHLDKAQSPESRSYRRARKRALQALVDAHPDEFHALLQGELLREAAS